MFKTMLRPGFMQLLCLLIVLITSLFAPSNARAETLTIQLNWKPEPQFGGFYAAEVLGHYKSAGLDVKVEPGGSGAPTLQMVAAGRVPFAIVSGDELVIARSRGLDVVALFAVYQTNPQGIMTRADRGLTDISQIFDRPGVLAMQRGLPYAIYLERKYGFKTLDIVPSPFGDLTAYRTRDNYAMQCFVTSEPLSARKIGIEPKTFLIAEAGFNPYTTVLVTRRDQLERHAERTRTLVEAVRLGWRDYLADPGPTNRAMQAINPSMDAETFTQSAAAQKPLIETPETAANGLGSMTIERWQQLIDQLADMKLIDKKPEPAAMFISTSKVNP